MAIKNFWCKIGFHSWMVEDKDGYLHCKQCGRGTISL